jgi:hypothetical protein
MNEDLFRYKTQFLTVVLLLGYAFLHTKLTGVDINTPLDDLINLSVPLPFSQRLFVPVLANFICRFLPIGVVNIFFLLEWLFISLSYFALLSLLRYEFEQRPAQLLAWLFILLLPLTTVVNYYYTIGGEVDIFYPWDSSTLFFMAFGFLLCLRAQWRYFIPLVFLATLNRETSILLVMMVPALNWQKRYAVIKPMIFSMLAYILARLLVLLIVHGASGEPLEWNYHETTYTNFELNLFWLLHQQFILLFMFCFAGLTLFWFAFYDYIPLQYRPLRYVALFYFLALLLVGRLMEGRIFIEIMVMLYLPVCVALSHWLTKQKPIGPLPQGFIYYVDRYAILTLLSLIVILHKPLIELSYWILSMRIPS